ncbi:hypothetical protein NDU88_002159 [Pleurodeles waltl]|uniref:Uncharacterized protein n=1 Tax=Pleurodeles waltl TaxID=8319 RepID=A0AAV7VDT3_PLEWA|nr:hypothetical protein NDU88_002159 [Pleurodeles waltl]
MVATLLHYRDCDHILTCARTKGDLRIDNHKIMTFPHFTKTTQKQQATFMDAKKTLQQLDLQYAMLFPARLRIVTLEGAQFFHTPQEVWNWLDMQVRACLQEVLGCW